jgi:hypothetical protein
VIFYPILLRSTTWCTWTHAWLLPKFLSDYAFLWQSYVVSWCNYRTRHTARCLRAAFGKVYYSVHKHRHCNRNFLVLRWKPRDCPGFGLALSECSERSNLDLRARLAKNINRQVIEFGATSRNRDFLFHFPFERRKLRARRARARELIFNFRDSAREQSIFGRAWSFEGISVSGNSPAPAKVAKLKFALGLKLFAFANTVIIVALARYKTSDSQCRLR